jgi:hypothetical protein
MRSVIAFFCCRAEAIERRQSSLVIVLKSGALFGAGEGTPLDPREFSGEGVGWHEESRGIRGRSRECRVMAKVFYGDF